jgi:hypothetical protein
MMHQDIRALYHFQWADPGLDCGPAALDRNLVPSPTSQFEAPVGPARYGGSFRSGLDGPLTRTVCLCCSGDDTQQQHRGNCSLGPGRKAMQRKKEKSTSRHLK